MTPKRTSVVLLVELETCLMSFGRNTAWKEELQGNNLRESVTRRPMLVFVAKLIPTLYYTPFV